MTPTCYVAGGDYSDPATWVDGADPAGWEPVDVRPVRCGDYWISVLTGAVLGPAGADDVLAGEVRQIVRRR